MICVWHKKNSNLKVLHIFLWIGSDWKTKKKAHDGNCWRGGKNTLYFATWYTVFNWIELNCVLNVKNKWTPMKRCQKMGEKEHLVYQVKKRATRWMTLAIHAWKQTNERPKNSNKSSSRDTNSCWCAWLFQAAMAAIATATAQLWPNKILSRSILN